jgi:hypothetical protein
VRMREPAGTTPTAASLAMSAEEHQRAPTPGTSPRTGSDGYQTGSPEQPGSNTKKPGSPGSRTASGQQADSGGYRTGSEEQRAASGGYRSGSEEPSPSGEVPGSGSDSTESVDPDERIDPFAAFAQAAAKERERKKREREPGIWLPGADELDHETGRLADQETRFSRDAWGGRGNPQVSVRLRPSDFERLRQAADLYGVRPTTLARMMVIRGVGAILDTELRRKGEFLRGGPS